MWRQWQTNLMRTFFKIANDSVFSRVEIWKKINVDTVMEHSILRLCRRPSIDTYIVYRISIDIKWQHNGKSSCQVYEYDGARTYCLLLPIVKYYSYVLFCCCCYYWCIQLPAPKSVRLVCVGVKWKASISMHIAVLFWHRDLIERVVWYCIVHSSMCDYVCAMLRQN